MSAGRKAPKYVRDLPAVLAQFVVDQFEQVQELKEQCPAIYDFMFRPVGQCRGGLARYRRYEARVERAKERFRRQGGGATA